MVLRVERGENARNFSGAYEAQAIFLHTCNSVRKWGFGVNPLLSLIFYKNCITWAKEINCFRILFAC